jgi:hypothetical protein
VLLALLAADDFVVSRLARRAGPCKIVSVDMTLVFRYNLPEPGRPVSQTLHAT